MSRKTSLTGQLTTDQASELLHVSLSNASRPIDVLVDRLSEPDGEAWLKQALDDSLNPREIELLRGVNASEADILNVKSRSKHKLADATSQQVHLAALACYCLAVARGLVSCNQLMSSRSGEEWTELLADLAGVMPVEWRDTVSRAAEAALRHGK